MGLSPHKEEFLRFSVASGALEFGSFTLKSGRVSPYFFNAGSFQTGSQLARLGEFYATVILEEAPESTIIFGPAYKGIPLCVAAAQAVESRTGRETGFLFNRKEEKTHGDRGRFVGRLPGPDDRLVLVDDVITDGGTKREAVELLRESFRAPIKALVIAFDRMERSEAGRNAIEDFENDTGITVHPIVTLADLEALMSDAAGKAAGALAGMPADLPADLPEQLADYRRRYGVWS